MCGISSSVYATADVHPPKHNCRLQIQSKYSKDYDWPIWAVCIFTSSFTRAGIDKVVTTMRKLKKGSVISFAVTHFVV